MYGFVFRRLALTGSGKPPAEVGFTRGLTVIAGPSDTGKSFIVQCLDYALGGGEIPKAISEADGYTTVELELESNQDQRVYKLERGLRGGNILCTSEAQSERTLAAKHKGGKEDSVSQFLLNLSGLGAMKVRTNARGTTRPLSFRDIARLVLVDEETVIKEISPVFSGHRTSETAESGVFRLLLTGTDDSSVVASKDPKIVKAHKSGQAELLVCLIKSARGRLASYGDVGIISEERDQLSRYEAALQIAIADRNAAQVNAAPLEVKRRSILTTLRATDSKLAVQTELQARFDLLEEQYSSDLKRLEVIAEAGVRLDQLNEERCPICGSLSEYHEITHRELHITPTDVVQACTAETVKIYRLLIELEKTRAATAAEVEELRGVRESCQHQFNTVTEELKALLAQQVEVAIKRVDELRTIIEKRRSALELLDSIQEWESLLEQAKKREKGERADGPSSIVSTAQADRFCREVESLLRSWNFPGLDRVSFSEDDQDIVISGLPRKSHGKGVRAILRSAFNLALLRLCVKEKRPFPNVVLIDSPLLVYEEPDPDEASFPPDIKRNFWESVKTSFTDVQVVIIENSKQLPVDGLGGANVVLFTGTTQGRRGFIPSD